MNLVRQVQASEKTQVATQKMSKSRFSLKRQKGQILAYCRAVIQKHEFQANYDRRSIQKFNGIIESQRSEINHALVGDEKLRRDQQLLHEQLLEQNRDLCEAHMKSLSEMEELKPFQGSNVDEFSRRLIEDRDTILELTEPRFRNYRMKVIDEWFERFWRCWTSTQWTIPRYQSTSVFSTFSTPGGMLSRSLGMPSRNDRPPSIWDTHGISGNVFANPVASSSAHYPQELDPWSSCEGCDIVQSDHAPQAGVAQGIFHGDLIRRRGWTSGRAGRGTGGWSRETGEERPLKRQDTSAHAWMIWNDTRGETLSHKCDAWTHVHQQTVRGVLRTAHCTRQCALWCPCHCSQCAPGCSCCAWRCTQFAVAKCSWIWGAGYIPFTPPVGDSRLPSAVTDFHNKNSKFFCTLRLFPQIDIQPPKYRFPCVISGHTIFEVSAQNQTPTSLNASAKKTRMKRFVPMLLASFCPLLASGAALLTTHF